MDKTVYNTLVQLEKSNSIYFGNDPQPLDEVMSCWFENCDKLPPLKLYASCGVGVFVWENEMVIFSRFDMPVSVCKIKDACVTDVCYSTDWCVRVGVRTVNEIPYTAWVDAYKAEKGEMPRGLPYL